MVDLMLMVNLVVDCVLCGGKTRGEGFVFRFENPVPFGDEPNGDADRPLRFRCTDTHDGNVPRRPSERELLRNSPHGLKPYGDLKALVPVDSLHWPHRFEKDYREIPAKQLREKSCRGKARH
ncbi:hypothetical protein [Paraburkholderia hiiakae]|uniref:hypothetical protein n=1 Tax=Paraburkholderia hiiakae TaxID=1081782 RepID=UPI001919884D|nr:hypothetical protein [Paraburkholderia hiiakae]